MIPGSPQIPVNSSLNIPASSLSPLINKSGSLKNENRIDNENMIPIKVKNKNDDNDNDNKNINNSDNNNNNNNVKSRSLSASYDFKKNNTHNITNKNDDVTAVRKYSGHTYVRTSSDTAGGGGQEGPYSSSTYIATASSVQSVGRYSIENLEFQGP